MKKTPLMGNTPQTVTLRDVLIFFRRNLLIIIVLSLVFAFVAYAGVELMQSRNRPLTSVTVVVDPAPGLFEAIDALYSSRGIEDLIDRDNPELWQQVASDLGVEETDADSLASYVTTDFSIQRDGAMQFRYASREYSTPVMMEIGQLHSDIVTEITGEQLSEDLRQRAASADEDVKLLVTGLLEYPGFPWEFQKIGRVVDEGNFTTVNWVNIIIGAVLASIAVAVVGQQFIQLLLARFRKERS